MKYTSQIVKYRAWYAGIGILLLLLIAVRVSLRSEWLLEVVRKQAESRVDGLHIAQVKGDLWGDIAVLGVSYQTSNEDITVDTIQVVFKPLSYFRSRYSVPRLTVIHPVATITKRDYLSQNVNTSMSTPLFFIEHLSVRNAHIDWHDSSLPADSMLRFRNLEFDGHLGYEEQGIRLRADAVSFVFEDGRLIAPVDVALSTDIDGGRITLEKLVMHTGRSVFVTEGYAGGPADSLWIRSVFDPLSWRDAAAYTPEPWFTEDLDVGLVLSGTTRDLELRLELHAPSLQDVVITAGISLEPVWEISRVSVETGSLKPGMFTGIEWMPEIESLALSLQGSVRPDTIEEASLTGTIRVEGIRYASYSIDRLQGELYVENPDIRIDLVANSGRETVDATLLTSHWTSVDPYWKVRVASQALNAAAFMPESAKESHINLYLDAEGAGLAPGPEPWTVRLRITDSWYGAQQMNEIMLSGTITDREVSAEGHLRPEKTDLRYTFSTRWSQPEPDYELNLSAQDFDISELVLFRELPSRLAFVIEARGKNTDLRNLQLQATLDVRDSELNGASIDRLTSKLALNGPVIQITESYISSAIADGSLSLRQHLERMDDPLNRLDFELLVKDPSSLAASLQLKALMLRGNVRGSVAPNWQGILAMDARVDVSDIVVDTIRADYAMGNVEVIFYEQPRYALDLLVRSPSVGELVIRDIALTTGGVFDGKSASGDYQFLFNLNDETGLEQRANYHLSDTLIRVRTEELNLFDNRYFYRSFNPFDFTMRQQRIRIDSLNLRGDSGSELVMSVHHEMGRYLRGWISARDFNLAILQRVIIDESYVDGYLTGDLAFTHTEKDLQMKISAELRALNYNNLEFDLLRFEAQVADERLLAELHVVVDEQPLLFFETDIPFRLGDPAEFEPAFFDRPVSARLELLPLDLTRIEAFFTTSGIAPVPGILTFSGALTGVANRPLMNGGLDLLNARLSGVSVDSLGMYWNYDHEARRINIDAVLNSLGQPAAVLNGYVPFELDLIRFKPEIPDEGEHMNLVLRSEKFNLAALNLFADPAISQNIGGLLEADLRFRGTPFEPIITGYLALLGGRVHLTENNITINDISAGITFNETILEINRLSMRSNGVLTGSGRVQLEGLVPTSYDIAMNATNFRLYDTRNMNIVVSTEMKLTGEPTKPMVTGALILERGSIFLENFGDRSLEGVILEEENPDGFKTLEFYQNLVMEMAVTTDGDVWIRNRSRPELAVELKGGLDLVKYQKEDIQIFGTMGSAQGYINQLGKRFVLEKGELTFSGDAENPALSVRSLYQLRQHSDVNIWYIVEGTASEPVFRYESDPEMELQDIISYTLFGRPFNALMSWQQTVSGKADENSLALDAAVDILLDRVEQLASERLGIDVVEIENTRSAGSSGTTIKAGKFVSDRLFVAILQELGNNVSSQVMIEYALQKNLDLVITGSDRYQTGVDLLWRRDY